jgi:hypothetical protein
MPRGKVIYISSSNFACKNAAATSMVASFAFNFLTNDRHNITWDISTVGDDVLL